MRVFYQHLKRHLLIYLGLIVYVLFYVSVARTGWFDILFSGAALHDGAKGIDFFQIPKGAWAFWHGGSLSGDLPKGTVAFAPQAFSNGNVYHPFFSLLLGSFLTLFDPDRLPYIWLWLKFAVSLPVLFLFYWNFRTSKYVGLALFLLLANFSIYLELAAWQFQFMLNMFLLLFLIVVVKRRSQVWGSILYWLGLLVKPVGLLFFPTLLFKGRWRTAIAGLWLFIVATVVFFIHDAGAYYTNNLTATLSSSGAVGPNQIITFAALLHYATHWPEFVYQVIHDGSLLLMVFLGTLRRTHISKAIFLAVAYYLSFYVGVFEYQWSTLPYVLAVCVVCCPEFQTIPAIICLLLTCLPDCFFLLNLWHIDVTNMGYLGLIPGPTAWEWMIVSKIVPLFLLLVSVLILDIKPIFKEMRVFWKDMRLVNARLKIFGDQPAVEQSVLVLHPQQTAALVTSQPQVKASAGAQQDEQSKSGHNAHQRPGETM
jgi:hypothetical protein